jgi:hypothetical protein
MLITPETLPSVNALGDTPFTIVKKHELDYLAFFYSKIRIELAEIS